MRNGKTSVSRIVPIARSGDENEQLLTLASQGELRLAKAQFDEAQATRFRESAEAR